MSPASKAYLASGLATGAAFTLTFDVVGIFAWAVDMEFRRATADDYPAIFRLQTANLLANLEPGERDGGFLAAGFTVPQIDQIARDLGIIVAEDRGIVVGCVCSLRPEFEHSPPAMTEMVRRAGPGTVWRQAPVRATAVRLRPRGHRPGEARQWWTARSLPETAARNGGQL